MTKTLHIGNQEAVKAMMDLPATRHDITSSPDKFCLDAWPVQHGEGTSLFVTLHGQFTERMFFFSSTIPVLDLMQWPLINQCHQKGFGRLTVLSFWHPHLLIRGMFPHMYRTYSVLYLMKRIASRAKQSGWSVIILSDQLNVRSYSSHEAWRPGYMRVQAGEKIPTQSLNTWISSINPQARAQLETVSTFVSVPGLDSHLS